MIAQVAQRGMPGFSVSFTLLLLPLGFLPKFFIGFLRDVGLRLDDDGLAGGGGGGSLFTLLMIRPQVRSAQWRMSLMVRVQIHCGDGLIN